MLSESHVRNFGFRVGRLFGIEVWFHWTLLLVVVLDLLWCLLRAGELGIENPLGCWGLSTLALLLSLVIHELGHLTAAWRNGGDAERVVLWPLGGLVFPELSSHAPAHFRAAAAGPAATIALALLAAGTAVACGWPLLPFASGDLSFRFGPLLVQYLVLWNVFLAVLSLVPCYPSDGGRALHALLWSRTESYRQGAAATLSISRIFAFGAIAAGVLILILGFGSKTFLVDHPLLHAFGWGSILLAIHHFYEARNLRLRLQYGEEEEGLFGYDFSRGYTSLERSAPRTRPPSAFRRWRERARRRARARRMQREREMRERVDLLLEKIHRESMESLTREERRFLERAARYFKKSESSRE